MEKIRKILFLPDDILKSGQVAARGQKAYNYIKNDISRDKINVIKLPKQTKYIDKKFFFGFFKEFSKQEVAELFECDVSKINNKIFYKDLTKYAGK